MIAAGILIGFVLAAPVFFALGAFARADRSTTHVPADISAALRRNVR